MQAEAIKERIRGGDEKRADMFDKIATALLDECARAVVDPETPTPPGGTWLAHLQEGLRQPTSFITEPAQRFLIRRAAEARHLIRTALGIAKFTGDLDWLGAAERWLDRIDQGFDPRARETGEHVVDPAPLSSRGKVRRDPGRGSQER